MEIIGYVASIFIGLVLGLVGGGGSILTVPVLVYLFKINAQLATTYSLFIIGITAIVGVYGNYKSKNLHFKSALIFAIPSVFSLLLIRKLILPEIPNSFLFLNQFTVLKNSLILVIFAILMLSSAAFMIRKSNVSKQFPLKSNKYKLAIIGFLVGILIGFLGAGGGFIIIPALLFFANLDMKQTIGTSLLIIAINSSIGFSSDIIDGVAVDFVFLTKIATLSIAGMVVGTTLSRKIDGKVLKPVFGWFVLCMGLYIIGKEILFW